MRRDPAIQPLSRDHHRALEVALKLVRANAETRQDAQSAFVRFWREHGQQHFRAEEEVLLPAYAEYGDPAHPAVVRVLTDHVIIRQRAARIERTGEEPLAGLQELGARLRDHVRHEERELFPLIEQALPANELERLGKELAAAEDNAG